MINIDLNEHKLNTKILNGLHYYFAIIKLVTH